MKYPNPVTINQIPLEHPMKIHKPHEVLHQQPILGGVAFKFSQFGKVIETNRIR